MLQLALFAGEAPHPTHGAARVLGRLAFAPQRQSPGGQASGAHAHARLMRGGSVLGADWVLTNIEPVVQADFDQMDVLPDLDVDSLGKPKREAGAILNEYVRVPKSM